jgi:hypothetical protein
MQGMIWKKIRTDGKKFEKIIDMTIFVADIKS